MAPVQFIAYKKQQKKAKLIQITHKYTQNIQNSKISQSVTFLTVQVKGSRSSEDIVRFNGTTFEDLRGKV